MVTGRRNGIMPRSWAPTFSIWCERSDLRVASKFLRPVAFSSTQAAAHWPLRQERAGDVSSWPNWLAAEILLRETEALLATPAAKAR